jgi:hypothetical protein
MKMKKVKEIKTGTYNNLLERIAEILNQARTKAIRETNRAQVLAYWEIGREIVEFEQKGKQRGEYGERLIEKLSRDMSQKFGRGFSSTNLKMMRLFYQAFPIRQTVSDESNERQESQTESGKSAIRQTLFAKPPISQTPSDQFEPMLSWSHYCELLKVDEAVPRSFYEQEAIQNNWSVRELKGRLIQCFLNDWL